MLNHNLETHTFYKRSLTINAAGEKVCAFSSVGTFPIFISFANKLLLPSNPNYQNVNYVGITQAVLDFQQGDKIDGWTITQQPIRNGRYTYLLLDICQ